jgi:hypothetical protein
MRTAAATLDCVRAEVGRPLEPRVSDASVAVIGRGAVPDVPRLDDQNWSVPLNEPAPNA